MSIGMMEGAFFVGRFELLNWLNDLLQLEYTKIEQCASGAAYCQIMDAVMPGRVPLQKVNFEAKFDYEYVKNYKVLQTFFEQNAIDKTVDVQRLIKAKYQDNLEFLQWIKRYYDIHANQEDPYNATQRRQLARQSKAANVNRANIRPATTASQVPPLPAVKRLAAAAAAPTTARPASSPQRKPAAAVNKPAAVSPTRGAGSRATAAPGSSSSAMQRQVNELTREVNEMQATIDALEKERDFYFGKLRAVEILCQDIESTQPGVAKPVLEVLYSDAGDNEISVRM